jgi:replicative DNA helicase
MKTEQKPPFKGPSPKDLTPKMRFELESAILGSMLLEGSFGEVMDILQPNNFSRWETSKFLKGNEEFMIDHQIVFKAIRDLYPASPTDILSVNMQIKKAYGLSDYSEKLCRITERPCSLAALEHWAMVLVETTMVEAFKSMLLKKQFSSALLQEQKMDILTDLEFEEDSVAVIVRAANYFAAVGEEAKEFEVFNEGLKEKFAKLRARSTDKSLIFHIKGLARALKDYELTEKLITIITDHQRNYE